MANIISIVLGLLGALFGAAIGGWATLKAAKISNAHQLKLQKEEHRRNVLGVLRAVRCELEVLGEFYGKEAGKFLASLKSGEPLLTYFSLTERYFIVYPANTALIAQLDDPELSRNIITVYNKANFLIEMFRINNRYLDMREECERLSRDGTEPKYRVRGNKILSLQIQHSTQLKGLDVALKSETSELLDKIAAYLARSEIALGT
jgi:hypothetical protein